jgi:predicted ATP-dependent Lon-type protease
MKTKIKEKVIEAGKKIKRFKVKLDYKTFITIKDINALDLWKARYPNAKVIGTVE